MKYASIVLGLLMTANSLFGQQENAPTRIFIVRHAEKETGKDPVLSPAGYKRAGDLYRTLQNEGIQKIYVSRTRRSQLTADSLRIQQNIDTVHYTADTICDELINTIIEHKDFGKTILIIAHSNTISHILLKLGVSDFPAGDLPDTAFDNLFLVTYKKEKARLKQMKYGDRSGNSASMKTSQ